MDIVVVLVLGLAAGIGVYLVSMRWDGPATVLPGEGFLPEEERMQSDALQAAAEAAARPMSGDYVPLAPGRGRLRPGCWACSASSSWYRSRP